jgi:hypothetical protein
MTDPRCTAPAGDSGMEARPADGRRDEPGPVSENGHGAGTGPGDETTDTAETRAAGPAGWLAAAARRPVLRHLALIAAYLAAGVAVTWPRATYLTGRLPETRDVASYIWDLQWVAHQVIHLGSPWFTPQMAAPAGIQLGFDTIMPLAGLIMMPVTLAFGPSAAFTLLTIVTPGLACYVMYRAARLWLATPGAIAAGALFGLASMLDWQDWYHLNIALGTLFLPMTLEAAIRLRRKPGRRQSVILGLVLGASVLVNQESAVLAGALAVVIMLSWILRPGPAADQHRRPARTRVARALTAVIVAVVLASPQLVAMAQQAIAGGASAPPDLLAHTGKEYAVGLPGLFAPTIRVADFGLQGLATASSPLHGRTGEGMPMFGLLLSVLALLGLAAAWRRRPAWLFALLWLGCAALALGPSLYIVKHQYLPLPQQWRGAQLSLLMPYTWLMHTPGLSALREADRFALLGLVGAVILAGAAVDWLSRHAKPVIIVVAALAVFEAGWQGGAGDLVMPTSLPRVDGPIAADHSGSIVVDVPYGLRGGIPQFGSQFSARALLMATADDHPRAISYTSWVPAHTISAISNHAFYAQLNRSEHGIPLGPARNGNRQQVSASQLTAARQDAREMHLGWAIVWNPGQHPFAINYLTAAGFRFAYQADGVRVYRFTGA